MVLRLLKIGFLFIVAIPSMSCRSRIFEALSNRPQVKTNPCAAYSKYKVIPNSATAASTLQQAVNESPGQETCIYLSSASAYKVNLVVANRTAPLFIHGINRNTASLSALNPDLPVMTVSEGTLFNLANISVTAPMKNAAGAWHQDYVLVKFNNQKPIEFQLQDGQIIAGMINFNSPGKFRLQGVFGRPCGTTTAAFMADHPQADLIVVGGNVYNSVFCKPQTGEYHHVWKKHGRVRVFDIGFQINQGSGDVRIDHASAMGADQIGYVRSEGTNAQSGTPQDGVLPSGLLTVSASTERVDVMLVASALMMTTVLNRAISYVADYNAMGTLWLVADNAFYGADILVKGNPPAPGANVVALGNQVSSDTGAFTITPANLVYASNLYDYCIKIAPSACVYPRTRNIAMAGGSIANLAAGNAALSIPPPLDIPLPLGRPVMDQFMPAFVNVKDLGAKGDGVTDDTAAIQSAMIYSSAKFSTQVYFPPGTYRTTSLLRFTPGTGVGAGGWFAGAGPDKTIIKRDPASGVGVFFSDAFAYFVIQGITFQTKPYDPADASYPQIPNFNVEYAIGTGPASQEDLFYDVVFDGGYDSIAFGNTTTNNSSENMVINSVFRNSAAGMSTGSYNALNNLIYNGRFERVGMLLRNGGNGGGSHSIFYGNATGCTGQATQTLEAVDRTMLIYKVTADCPSMLYRGYTSGARFGLYLEEFNFVPNVTTVPAPAAVPYPLDTTGGHSVFFVRSSMPAGAISLNSAASGNTFFKAKSSIPGWNSSRISGAHSTLYTIDP